MSPRMRLPRERLHGVTYLKGKWTVRLKWQFLCVFQAKKAKFLMSCFEAQMCLDRVPSSFKGLPKTSPPATSDGWIKCCNYDQRPPTPACVITHFPASESHFVPQNRRWETDTSDVCLLVSQGFGKWHLLNFLCLKVIRIGRIIEMVKINYDSILMFIGIIYLLHSHLSLLRL